MYRSVGCVWVVSGLMGLGFVASQSLADEEGPSALVPYVQGDDRSSGVGTITVSEDWVRQIEGLLQPEDTSLERAVEGLPRLFEEAADVEGEGDAGGEKDEETEEEGVHYADPFIMSCVQELTRELYEGQTLHPLPSGYIGFHNFIRLRDAFSSKWDQTVGEHGSLYLACVDRRMALVNEAASEFRGGELAEQEEDLSAYVQTTQELPCHPHVLDGMVHHAGSLKFRWYQPEFDRDELPEENTPCIVDLDRRRTLIVIHAWQGWNRKAYRQKLRLFHNAKEDIISAGSMVVSKGVMDLSFVNITGSGASDDLGMMLQCMPPADSVVSRGKVSLVDYLQYHGTSTCDTRKSYNVGFIDWSAYSYNRTIRDAEKSIWKEQGDRYISDEDLLALLQDVLVQISPHSTITLVGHSLGAGLAIRAYHVLAQALQEKEIPAGSPHVERVVLADPYFSNAGPFPMDAGYWPGELARKTLDRATSAMRHYQKDLLAVQPELPDVDVRIVTTRADATELFSDANDKLKLEHPHTVYVELQAQGIRQDFRPFAKKPPVPTPLVTLAHLTSRLISHVVAENKRKHLYPLYWFMDTLARSIEPALVLHGHEQQDPGFSGASSSVEAIRIREASRGRGWYRQKQGGETRQTSDDAFEFRIDD